jgi:hypothetical protein
MVALYVGMAAAFGRLALLTDAEQALHLDSNVRFDLILAVLIAYSAAASRLGRRGAVRDLSDLRPTLRVSDAEHAALLRVNAYPDRRRVAAALVLGAATGAALNLLAEGLAAPELVDRLQGGPLPYSWGLQPVLGLVMNAILFALLGRLAYLSLAWAGAFSRLGRSRTEVRLLDPASRAPFARMGLRQAVFWFVGSSIASLLVLEAVAPGLVILVLFVTLTIGILALVLPARGIHQALRRAKRQELEWLRAAIEAERDALALAPAEAANAGARLPALLAYEARVAAVREWPFDASTLLRFALFLLLPLASWVGGALMERLLAVVLD